MILGAMEIPSDFRYLNVFLRGKPQHRAQDPFLVRHPAMDSGRRAKIFSPFDALKGFSEAVAAKDVLYMPKPELSEADQEEIGRRLGILHALTRNGRLTRENRIPVTVTRFVPCADPDHAAFGYRGQCISIRGICTRVDGISGKCLVVDGTVIPFEEILSLEAEGLFGDERETDIL